MINLSLNKQLSIILPNTNKALQTVLQNATPQELQTLTKDKDLKSILNTLLKQSASNTAQDKTLLDLVKNNPTLKNLGNVTQTLKDLVQNLKQDETPLPLKKEIIRLLDEVKKQDTKESPSKELPTKELSLKEPQTKQLQTPKAELKQQLQELTKLLENEKQPTLKNLNVQIKELLSKDITPEKTPQILQKDAPALTETTKLKSSLQEIVQNFKQEESLAPLKRTLTRLLSDIQGVNDKELKTKIDNSGVFLESKIKQLQSPIVELKQQVQELSKQLENTKLPNVQNLNQQLKEILNTEILKNASNAQLLNATKIDVKLLTDLTKNLQTVTDKISQSLNSQLDQSTNPKDVVFTKEVKTLIEHVKHLSKPEQLQSQAQVKEMFSNDLKAVLLKTQEEINTSSHPNKQELLKQIDKLSLQIDYHQLVSHLSNSSSLYIPYAWDALDDGNISMKSAKEDKFFCDIDLKLKEYGDLKLRLGLFEQNQLNINITTSSQKLKSLLQESMPELKKQLFSAGLLPQSIRFLDEKKSSDAYGDSSTNLDVGFEVKA